MVTYFYIFVICALILAQITHESSSGTPSALNKDESTLQDILRQDGQNASSHNSPVGTTSQNDRDPNVVPIAARRSRNRGIQVIAPFKKSVNKVKDTPGRSNQRSNKPSASRSQTRYVHKISTQPLPPLSTGQQIRITKKPKLRKKKNKKPNPTRRNSRVTPSIDEQGSGRLDAKLMNSFQYVKGNPIVEHSIKKSNGSKKYKSFEIIGLGPPGNINEIENKRNKGNSKPARGNEEKDGGEDNEEYDDEETDKPPSKKSTSGKVGKKKVTKPPDEEEEDTDEEDPPKKKKGDEEGKPKKKPGGDEEKKDSKKAVDDAEVKPKKKTDESEDKPKKNDEDTEDKPTPKKKPGEPTKDDPPPKMSAGDNDEEPVTKKLATKKPVMNPDSDYDDEEAPTTKKEDRITTEPETEPPKPTTLKDVPTTSADPQKPAGAAAGAASTVTPAKSTAAGAADVNEFMVVPKMTPKFSYSNTKLPSEYEEYDLDKVQKEVSGLSNAKPSFSVVSMFDPNFGIDPNANCTGSGCKKKDAAPAGGAAAGGDPANAAPAAGGAPAAAGGGLSSLLGAAGGAGGVSSLLSGGGLGNLAGLLGG